MALDNFTDNANYGGLGLTFHYWPLESKHVDLSFGAQTGWMRLGFRGASADALALGPTTSLLFRLGDPRGQLLVGPRVTYLHLLDVENETQGGHLEFGLTFGFSSGYGY
ncbi:MAG: hypothetical protein AAGA56_21475 [Myxococcota bacterium]